MRAFDQSIVERVLGSIEDTDQVGRQVWSGVVFPIAMPSVAPNGTDYFKLDSTRFRIPVLHYDLYVSENADDSMQQWDNNFQVAFVLDKGARSEVVDGSNVEPDFWKIWARADRLGRYMYITSTPPRQNVRYMDRFEVLQDHLVEVPPQWDWNSRIPDNGVTVANQTYDYNDGYWQGVMPWDESVYQPRPGFPGPWTGEGPDPRTPYIQGDGADMSREFRWGQETIQFGKPLDPCNSGSQTETTRITATDIDEKFWCHGFQNSPGLWGFNVDYYPAAGLATGVVPQRPAGIWNSCIGGYATIGHEGAEAASLAQQTHRVVKAREGARAVRTNFATYKNDVDVLIDGRKTNFKSGSIVLENDVFQQFTTVITPGGGFAPETITSYDKRLYLTIWRNSTGATTDNYVPVIEVQIRVEFESIY